MTELKKRVLDALNELGGCGAKPGSYEKGWDDAIDAAWRAVKALDDRLEARWVPVTERLPEESGMYIVTANDGHAQRVSFVLWQKKNRMWNLVGARSYWRVTHWMPLPEPPKGE